ncbi:hypothetical protein TNCV_2391371 [Trichonephila clavipes]|nr:hypothetical protein TNCV_2391371 [Trichonephila clavipes]
MFQILLWSPWKYRCGQRTVRMAVMACSQNQAVFARRRSELKLKLELVEEKQKLLDIRKKRERESYTRAFSDGPRNFKLWPSDEDDTGAGTPSPNYHPSPREDVSALDRFSVHRCPTRRVFSGSGLKLVTKPATIQYLYHSATVATLWPRSRMVMLENSWPAVSSPELKTQCH